MGQFFAEDFYNHGHFTELFSLLLFCQEQILHLIILVAQMFWTPGLPRVYPMGSMVIALVSPSVGPLVRPSVFKYLGDRSLVFSETLHEVRDH